jgi:hypothetical protein
MTAAQIQQAMALGYTPETVANFLPLISQTGGGAAIGTGSPAPGGTSGAPPGGYAAGFAGLSGGEQTEVATLVNEFLSLVGFPEGVDAFKLDWLLAQSGLFTDAMQAMNFLFGQLSSDQQQKAPWAQVGMDAVSYHQRVGGLKSQWYDLTGQDMPQDMLLQALQGNWTAQQLMQNAERSTSLTSLEPWLAEGQTFQTAQESYIASYGHAPADSATLGGWWRFKTGARQIGAGRPATQQLGQQAEQRLHDVEIR